MAGIASKYRNQKPDVYASLGTSFRALDSQILDTNEFQLKFYQKECQEYLDEYIIHGNQLVKIIGSNMVKRVATNDPLQ